VCGVRLCCVHMVVVYGFIYGRVVALSCCCFNWCVLFELVVLMRFHKFVVVSASAVWSHIVCVVSYGCSCCLT